MPQNAFNIVHFAVVLLCVVVIVTIAVVVIDASRRTGPRITTESTQLRGIHQGLVTYANSNKDYYVGLNPDGTMHDLSVEYRFQFLIDNDFFTPEYAISPLENDSAVRTWDQQSPFTANHYSYAMLQIPEEGGRRAEWRTTLNTQAIVISDRNTGTKAKPSSIHSDPAEPWAGSILWNDNIAYFENGGDTFETKYGGGELNEADRLFESPGTDDALLIHTGN